MKCVAELLPLELLFHDIICIFAATCLEPSDFLEKNEATISSPSAHWFVRNLATSYMKNMQKWELLTGWQLIFENVVFQNSLPPLLKQLIIVHLQNFIESGAQRFNGTERCLSKINGDTNKCCDEHVDNYRQIAQYYKLKILRNYSTCTIFWVLMLKDFIKPSCRLTTQHFSMLLIISGQNKVPHCDSTM